MRVLYLASPRKRPEQITAFSFIDEELEALAAAGVEAYVLSTEVEREHRHRGARLCPVPPARSPAERLAVLRFLYATRALLPGTLALRRLPYLVHVARIEQAAAQLAQREGIEVLHSHFGYPGGFGGLLARRATGLPLVASFRGMDLVVDAAIGYGLRGDAFYDRNVRALLRTADQTTYVSDFMRRAGLALGAPAERATTIWKGVDLERFSANHEQAACKQALGLQGPVVLAVAGLSKRKGLDHILEALGRLRETHAFTFVVCGTGSELSALQAQARALGLAERTRFVGRIERDEIARYFAACDVFVLASLHEASGNVLLEAMASARPVVCTDSGGPPEYVADGETGFVVPPADPPALAERLRHLLDDAALRARFGRAGRARAERRFAYGRMIDDLLGVYRRVTGGAPRGGRPADAPGMERRRTPSSVLGPPRAG